MTKSKRRACTPKACLDFIKNQHNAMRITKRTQILGKLVIHHGKPAFALYRLGNHRTDVRYIYFNADKSLKRINRRLNTHARITASKGNVIHATCQEPQA